MEVACTPSVREYAGFRPISLYTALPVFKRNSLLLRFDKRSKAQVLFIGGSASFQGIPRCECLPGHRGAECNQCMPGYHRRSESTGCRPINCLSYSLCQEEPDRPGCQDCDFSVQLHESFSPVAQKSNADPFAQGTLTVIAILSGFCFLLFAATLATCYHHRRRAGLVALSNSPTYWNAMPPDAQQTFDCNEYIQMGPANGTLHRRENEGYGGYQATTKLAMQLVNQQGEI